MQKREKIDEPTLERIRLLLDKDPVEYARTAISVLNDQLVRTRTEKRRRKIQANIDGWLAFIEAASPENG